MKVRPGKTYNISQLFDPKEASKVRRLPPGALVEYNNVELVKTGINKVTYQDGRKTENN